MSLVKSFDYAFNRMRERQWEKIYVLVDIHDTIFKACYHQEERYEWFPYAMEVLQMMSRIEQISLILWTSSYHNRIEVYNRFFLKNDICFDMINQNTETENTDLSCFDEKTYFNVGIDDKFGFDPLTDWEILHDYLPKAIRNYGLTQSIEPHI